MRERPRGDIFGYPVTYGPLPERLLRAGRAVLRALNAPKATACPHEWRPGVMRGRLQSGKPYTYPARHCDLCDTTERMQLDAFFAHFGRMPW